MRTTRSIAAIAYLLAMAGCASVFRGTDDRTRLAQYADALTQARDALSLAYETRTIDARTYLRLYEAYELPARRFLQGLRDRVARGERLTDAQYAELERLLFGLAGQTPPATRPSRRGPVVLQPPVQQAGVPVAALAGLALYLLQLMQAKLRAGQTELTEEEIAAIAASEEASILRADANADRARGELGG